MPKTALEDISPDLLNDFHKAGLNHSADRITRLLYSTDASIYQMVPTAVVWPKNDSQVCAAIEIAQKHNSPILPRGSGTSLAGQAIGEAIILDFSSHMDQILDLNPEEKSVRVQPGLVLGSLNRYLSSSGLMFGPDPASADRATIGGVLGNNATGAHSILYGMAHDHLLEAEVVLSDGSMANFKSQNLTGLKNLQNRSTLEAKIYRKLPELINKYQEEIKHQYPRTFRNVAGYNLNILANQKGLNPAALLAGSEGTLGIITAAKLNLVQAPSYTTLYLIHFNDLRPSLECIPEILDTKPSAVELIDDTLIDLTRANPAYRSLFDQIEGDPAAVLAVEYQGEELAALKGKENLLAAYGHTVPIVEPDQQERIWNARKVGLGILLSKRGDEKPTSFIEDAAVPVEHLADYALEIKSFSEEIGVKTTAFYAHASAGLLHIRPAVNLKNSSGLEQMRLLAEKSLELVMRFGGTITGEHGEGIARGEFSRLLYGEKLTRAFKEVKEIFDPDYLFNPGKIINPPKMDQDELLRYGVKYQTRYLPEETKLSFRDDQGFDRAIEMCNGAGVCRQLDQGVMCPSFKATRDETHSTRGRANLLRAAISGKLGPEGFTSQDLFQVLDLCLSCQACASECPSAVDMSKLKAEFLHQYQMENGIPFRSWFFAHIAEVSHIAQPFSRLVNPLLQSPLKCLFSLMGIHPKREMPAFAKTRFSSWYDKQSNISQPELDNGVVFFYDTYLEYNYPQIGQAIVNIFQKAGIKLHILKEKSDSGRPAYSTGLLNKAQRLAKKNLDLLQPFAEKGMPIIGCEPTVVVMLKREYRDLIPGSSADLVAKSTMLVEDYLIQEISTGRIQFSFDHQPRTILYHGHCQQKSHLGTDNIIQLLSLIPGSDIEEIKSTCCGMAGAFGYEKEHYQLSLEIAELDLAPRIRNSSPGSIICASGTSCREQIKHTTHRNALHPLQVFAEALV